MSSQKNSKTQKTQDKKTTTKSVKPETQKTRTTPKVAQVVHDANLTRRQKRGLIHPKSHLVEVKLTNGDSINIEMANACVQKDFVQLGSDFYTNHLYNKNLKKSDVRGDRAKKFAEKYKINF